MDGTAVYVQNNVDNHCFYTDGSQFISPLSKGCPHIFYSKAKAPISPG